MKYDNGKMEVSLLVLAVQAALLAMSSTVQADEEEVAALVNPTSTVEVGMSNTSRSSAKFGEYTGQNRSGGDFIGNINARGGDIYGDSHGTHRWTFNGNDLGLSSRSVNATLGNQGQWNIGIGYDGLRHNLSDSYQTPYLGTMGGNSFMLPAGFGTVANTNTGLTAAQRAALHPVNISTERTNGSFTAGVNLNAEWSVKFDYNHLSQSGAKLMGFGSMANTAAGITGETVAMLPNPTNYKTDTLNLALNWVGEKGFMTTSYHGSFFRDGYDRVDFQTFGGANAVQTMSTMPGNTFNQLNLNGGYAFSPRTKLTGGLSYAKNTQNDAYVTDAYSMVVNASSPPTQTSLNGDVRNTHADLKLIDQTTRDLALSAAVKFDERKDRTASNFYYFNALDGAANHQAYFPNTPYSNRKAQFELAGDYRLDRDSHLRLAYNRENYRRWCDQYAVGGLGPYPIPPATATGQSIYPAGTDCVVAPHSRDDKLSLGYKLRAGEDVNVNIGYSYSKRTTESDPNAITARIGLNGNINPAGAAATLIMGQNAGDFRGFYPFFDASRKEQMLKAAINWQTTDRLSLSMGGKYTDDKYPDSTYGVNKGFSWSLNLDATYNYSESGSLSTYLSQDRRQRDLTDLQRSPYTAANPASTTAIAIPSGATWSDTLRDQNTTVGLGAKQGGLMASKLELTGDFTYSVGKTGYATFLNYNTTTSGGLTCASAQILTCGNLPEINNRLLQFKVSGKYQLDKNTRVVLGYLFQQLKSTDYYYNALLIGNTSNTMMPTNQVAPNYAVNVVTASYILSF